MNPKPILSLVVPCFNEEEALPVFYETAEQELEVLRSRYEIEYIFIDDGSKDATLAGMRDLAEKDQSVHYISFSRNFGKEAALYAGLERSSGDITVTLDVDLQDPPSLIPEMVKAVTQEGFDCAGSRRVTRKGEPPVRSFFARRFYRLINRLSDVEIVDGARDFRCMNREYLNAVLSLKERNRFSKGIFPWVGFKTKWFEYENRERSVGETKWSFFKLLLYSLDGIAAFSTKPLAAASVWKDSFRRFVGRRLGIVGLHSAVYGRFTASHHWSSRAVCGQNLYRSQTTPAVCYKGAEMKTEPLPVGRLRRFPFKASAD